MRFFLTLPPGVEVVTAVAVARQQRVDVPADDLTCRELVELVTEYLDGALTLSEQARFEAHLAHCPECRGHLEDMRLTIRLVGGLTEQSLSPSAVADLVGAFRGWRRG